MQKSGLVWEIDNVCLFLTYEVPSANSSPFISLCIVYSNIGHRAHKSSPRAAKTAPFVCTVLTDSILCPLTSSLPLPLLSARLCPLKHINRPRLCRAIMFLFLLIIFFTLVCVRSVKARKYTRAPRCILQIPLCVCRCFSPPCFSPREFAFFFTLLV